MCVWKIEVGNSKHLAMYSRKEAKNYTHTKKRVMRCKASLGSASEMKATV